jgi:hypothetical protein
MNGSERELVVPGEFPLSATLHLPPEDAAEAKLSKHPAILFIQGSGALDRNENARRIRLNVFNYLAEEFGKLGFVSFRYDKRGVGRSKGSFKTAGLWDFVDDAARALAALKSQPEVDTERIILLGHSEGCYIAPLVGQRTQVAGMVLLMAPADRLDTVILEQAAMMEDALRTIKGLKGSLVRLLVRVSNGGSLTKVEEKLLKKVRESTKPVVRFRLARVNAKWIREHLSINPTEVYSSVSCPVLIVNGSKDCQVTPTDARKVAMAVKGPSEWHIVEGMTHILRKDLQDGPSILHYKKLVKEKMDPEIARLTGDWLERNFLERKLVSVPANG